MVVLCNKELRSVCSLGLTAEELDLLGRLGKSAIKTSTRDIAYVMATEATGAITVAATSVIAAQVGIKVFVTGGIGGVHRLGESSMFSEFLSLHFFCNLSAF